MENGFLRSTGVLNYGPKIRLVLNVDQQIADFYRSLIPKWFDVNPQKYPAHVSIVRREIPLNMDFWQKYEGQEVEFQYSPRIMEDETYYWLDVQSERLQEIREELGLKRFPPWRNLYHITIGNKKKLVEGEASKLVNGYFKFT